MAKYVVKNISKRPVTIDDISTYGVTIEPGKKMDLLRVVTQDQIIMSTDLTRAVKMKLLKVYDQIGSEIENVETAVGYLDKTVVDVALNSTGSTGPQGPPGPQGPAGSGGVAPSSSTFTRNGNGAITAVDYENGRTVVINRTGDQITSVVDSLNGTYTINRDLNGVITGIDVS